MRTLLLITGTCVLASCSVTQAEEKDRSLSTVRVGFGGMGGVAVHVARFSSLPELPTCCPQFRDGSGLTASLHVWGEYPFFPPFSLGARISSSNIAGQLRALERKSVLVNDQPTEAVIQHIFDTRFTTMRWEGYVSIRTSSLLDVYVGAGTELVRRAEGSVHEELVQPTSGTFENGKRRRNEQSSELTSTRRSMAILIAGMRFGLPLSSTRQWMLLPELSFRYSLDAVTPPQQWYVYTVQVGVGLAFQTMPLATLQMREPPTVPLPTPLPLEASIVAYGSDGSREPQALSFKQHRRLQRIPLLPVVYMDGTLIPERYILPEEPDDPNWRASITSPLSAYYAVLALIGERMRTCNDTLTLIGIDSQSRNRGQMRATMIARYLQAVWRVSPSRLRITSRIDERDTTARVLLHGSDCLLGTVQWIDTVTLLEPSLLRLRPATNGAEMLRRWLVRVLQDSLELVVKSGKGGLPLRIDIELGELVDRIRVGHPMVVDLQVEGASGRTTLARTEVPIGTPMHRSGESEETGLLELFLLPTEHLTLEAARELALQYRHRLRDIAIVGYGNSLEIDDAISRLAVTLHEVGLPQPRIERRPELYRPLTPERIIYSALVMVQVRYAQ